MRTKSTNLHWLETNQCRFSAYLYSTVDVNSCNFRVKMYKYRYWCWLELSQTTNCLAFPDDDSSIRSQQTGHMLTGYKCIDKGSQCDFPLIVKSCFEACETLAIPTACSCGSSLLITRHPHANAHHLIVYAVALKCQTHCSLRRL